ncbi:unhealthy ribosome biogenesis protein 2 homolog isoform X2 [Tubulanus polymorphus]|uniref:unhealthy ribosome biogenesis protein 2 homolog isoform X2 n=1 Tax=Tubulanus polymorphus TaxID=672921 RepID=UPI003DA6016F
MATSTEILSHIENGPNPWNDRVLLARYAWLTEDVVITNKPQMILNLLIERLVSHDLQKLTVEDTKMVFETVCDMLNSDLCLADDMLILPIRFSNFLISQMRHFMVWNRSVAFRCVCAIFRSKSLQVLFNVHINRLLIAWLSSHLLSPILLLWKRFQTDTKHSKLLMTLRNTICDIMFASEGHKHMIHHFDVHVQKTKQKENDPKCFVLFHKTITTLWSSPPEYDHNLAMVEFIPWFYKQFILKSHGSNFDMLRYLMIIIGVDFDNDSTDFCLVDGNSVIVIERLLAVVVKQEVYDVASDNENGKEMKNWFEKLVNFLLNLKTEETMGSAHEAWFHCLLHILELNYELLFKNVLKIWKHCWIQTNQDDPVTVLCNKLLIQLTETYRSLSQTEKFITEILMVIQLEEKQIEVSWPTEFLTSFGKVINGLNISQVKAVWAMFIDELSDFYINKVMNQSFVVELFYKFLMSIQIPDYNMASKTAEDISLLMKRTLNEVIDVWSVKIIKKQGSQSERKTFLMLASMWAEIRMLLLIYGRECDWLKLGSIDDVTSNMSCIVPVYYPEVWNVVCSEYSAPTEEYFMSLLWTQKMKAALLMMTDSNRASTMVVITEGVKQIFKSDTGHLFHGQAWNGTVGDISRENYEIAQWKILLGSLTNTDSIPQKTLLPIIQNIINSITESTLAERSVEIGFTHYSLSQQFLGSETCEEAQWLHPPLVAYTWLQIAETLFTGLSKSSKAGKDFITLFKKFLKEDAIPESQLSEFLIPVRDQLIKNWDGIRQSSRMKIDPKVTMKLKLLLQILSKLPIDSLSSGLLDLNVVGLLLALALLIPNGEDVYPPRNLDLQTLPMILFGLLHRCWNRNVYEFMFSSCVASFDVSTILIAAYTYTDKRLMLTQDDDEKSLAILEDYRKLVSDIARMVFIQFKNPLKLFEKINKFNTTKRGKILGFWTRLVIRNCLAKMKNTQKSCETTAEMKILHEQITNDLLNDIPKNVINVVTMLPAVIHLLSSCLAKCQVIHSNGIIHKTNSTDRNEGKNGSSDNEENADADMDNHDSSNGLWLQHVNMITKQAFDCLTTVGSVPLLVYQAYLSYIMTLVKTLSSNAPEAKAILTKVPDDIFHFTWKKLSGFKAQLHLRYISIDSPVAGVQKYSSKIEEAPMTDGWLSLMSSNPYIVNVDLDDEFLSLKRKLQSEMSTDGQPLVKKFKHTDGDTEKNVKNKTPSSRYDLCPSALKSLKRQVEETMATTVNCCDTDLFTSVVNGIHENMSSKDLNRDHLIVITAIDDWRCLLKFLSPSTDNSLDKKTALTYLSREVLVRYQHILQFAMNCANPGIVEHTIISILQSEVNMLTLEVFLPVNAVHLCLNSIHHTPLCEDVTLHIAVKCIPAVYNILNLLLNNNVSIVMEMKPAFLGCCRKLLNSVIYHGNQATIQASEVDEMVNCAHLVGKLLTNISYHRTEFCRLACYIVSDYVFEVQKVTLVPSIKRALLPGIYALMSLCDDHASVMMFGVLDHGIRELLKGLYADYNKYYKYTGTV